LEFRILGPLEVLEADGVLPLGGEKQRAALAILLLHRNAVVSRDRLVEGMWGDAPPVSAGPTLDTYVSRLRKLLRADGLGPRLVTRTPGYLLRVEDGELDLQRFEVLLDRARSALASADHRAAGGILRGALSLFRGAPLEDLAHVPFAQAEVGRLEELRLGALEQRLESDLEIGDHAAVVGELESLVVRFPFRERFWAQLMLAQYRSGRQGDALVTFDRARRTLTEELGVDPGLPLQRLHKRILRQDPTLDAVGPAAGSGAVATIEELRSDSAPHVEGGRSAIVLWPPPAAAESPTSPALGERRPHPRFPGAHQRVAAAVSVVLIVVLVTVLLLPRLLSGGGNASTAYAPGTVLIDLDTGHTIRSIPLTDLAVAAYPIFAGGHFWVNNWSPSAYVEIDPRTGTILRQISPPARDPNVHRDFDTVTPFTVQGDTLWVTSADDVVKMDIDLAREVGRFKLDDLGMGSGLAEGVAVGAGSVWVSRDVGRGQILRLDPITGSVEHTWHNITPYLNLAYGDGSLWMGDERGIARIDAVTNVISTVDGIQNNCGGGVGGCVVAGGGFGWTDDGSKGAIYKLDRAGHIAATFPAEIGAGFMSYADGVLWVGNHDDGTVIGIDALTGRREATYHTGHPTGDVVAGDGVLLLSLSPGRPFEARLDSLPGTVAKLFAHWNELGAGEPALSTDPGAYQIEFATCAKLLNYPDKPPPEGWQLQPEVAAALPTLSGDGRTYTFRIRPGYRFSPPSNQPVTAETFRYSIERALSPRLAEGPVVPNPPGPHVIDDIEGERAFLDGTASHISGIRAAGNTLSITLIRPSPDFLERLALPFFCPVPLGTPFVAGAPHREVPAGDGSIVSAGPYYVAYYGGDGYVILKRNPNYHGPRPHALDAIVIRENAAVSAALDRVQNHGWDGITSIADPELDPGGPLARRWGPGSAAAARGDPRYFLTPELGSTYIAFNSSRGIFADQRVRRAASLALDRQALAAAWGEVPTDQLLTPALPGYREKDLYPLTGSVVKARGLMHDRTGTAVMAIPKGCDRCTDAASLVRADLGAIGIEVRVRELDDLQGALESGAKIDLLNASTVIRYPDAGSFLAQMTQEMGLVLEHPGQQDLGLHAVPHGWLPPGVRKKIGGLANLGGNARQAAGGRIADELTTDEVAVAAYGTPQTSQFVGPKIGCRVFTSFGYGLDLAALCLKGSGS
jgi:DNA-binding SARP family transcriptional activator/ABC-type transport system substrate-binding protein/outer membrane protein assembly factor BamB